MAGSGPFVKLTRPVVYADAVYTRLAELFMLKIRSPDQVGSRRVALGAD